MWISIGGCGGYPLGVGHIVNSNEDPGNTDSGEDSISEWFTLNGVSSTLSERGYTHANVLGYKDSVEHYPSGSLFSIDSYGGYTDSAIGISIIPSYFSPNLDRSANGTPGLASSGYVAIADVFEL